LVANTVDAVLEAFGIGRRPPVAEVGLGVELPALIVEGVGELVTDGRAGVAVVWRVIQLRVVQCGCRTPAGKLMSFICGLK